MAKTIAIANQKGGVAKTFTARSLSAYLAAKGYKVLAVDADPQTDLTMQFGIKPEALTENEELTFRELMLGEFSNRVKALQGSTDRFEYNTADAIIKISENLSLLPTTEALTIVKEKLALLPPGKKESITRTILEPVKDDYDFIIIDCPPDLGSMTINLLSASDNVIIPGFADQQSLAALIKIVHTIADVKKSYNPDLQINGLLFCRVKSNTVLAQQYMTAMHKKFPFYIYDAYIPEAICAQEAVAQQSSILEYDKYSSVALAYDKFTDEFLKRIADMYDAE